MRPLRTLLTCAVVLLFTGSGYAADPKPAEPTEQQIEAVESVVRKLGGYYLKERDPDTKAPRHYFNLPSPSAETLKKLPIVPFPFELNCSHGMSDEGLGVLKAQKHLTALSVFYSGVTDKGLKELKGHAKLRLLDLGMTSVTDAGLKELIGLQEMRALHLTNNNITDAGVKELVKLKRLHTLKLFGTFVTDAGLKELTALKEMRELDLGRTKLTNAGLQHLASFEKLT